MNEKVREIIVKQITEKKELANCKAILSFGCLGTETLSQVSIDDLFSEQILNKVNQKELFYYIGYKQALNDVLASFAGEKYKFTEYEETCLVLD